MIGRKHITREQIEKDFIRLMNTIFALGRGECPVEMGLEAKVIEYSRWTAPARMDLAVTYGCNLRCSKCYLEGSQLDPLYLSEWLKVYEILWKIGVPQIVFTGGEPTLRSDIIELVSQADEFVTGMVTNGTRLVELAEPLMDASLDYVQVTIESNDPAIHEGMTGVAGSWIQTADGIQAALKAGLQVTTNSTITRLNAPGFIQTMEWLADMGVGFVACNTLICSGKGNACRQQNGLTDEELKPLLEAACTRASELGIEFAWYSPTCYNQGINPVQLGLGAKCCSAASHNMTIQPDGSVLPCQSWPNPVGNILTDKWSRIWNHPVCKELRDRSHVRDLCGNCEHILTCGGGCPLDKTPRTKS